VLDCLVAMAKMGYHILLEKPMAVTEEDCKKIKEVRLLKIESNFFSLPVYNAKKGVFFPLCLLPSTPGSLCSDHPDASKNVMNSKKRRNTVEWQSRRTIHYYLYWATGASFLSMFFKVSEEPVILATAYESYNLPFLI
jgi:hypothetical protein